MIPQHLLVGVDGSPESTAAARWAAAEAVRRGLPLRVVHAQTWLDRIHADPGQSADLRARTGRLLADAEAEVRRAEPGLEVRAELLEGCGEPVDTLVEAAADAQVLVLGSRGTGGFAGLMVGSVGLAVVGRTSVPTVLVRAGATRGAAEAGEAGEAGEARGEVVVGVGTRAPAEEVLEYAFEEAARRGAVLRAVHGWAPPPGYAGWVPLEADTERFRAAEAELLSEALAGWRQKYPEVAVVEDTRIGGAAAALVEGSDGAALVVVGRRRRPRLLSPRLGAVTHAVLHHSHAAVAVVPHM
ncbi:universal stress protein [Kitasatospora camelliae]|uniref:Universal stress protein n=1 Tax=Kitasatospora camelliae TaxID=3156397 RepID=A0AAU8K5Q3_9ACTN